MFVGMPPKLNETEILPETGSTITETTADTRTQQPWRTTRASPGPRFMSGFTSQAPFPQHERGGHS